jgi:hypothetical protein
MHRGTIARSPLVRRQRRPRGATVPSVGGIFDSVAVLGYNIGLEKAGGPSPLVGADPRQGAEGWALTNARACAIK